MQNSTRPLHSAQSQGLVARVGSTAAKASLLVSPKPMAMLLRRQFAAMGRERECRLATYAPLSVIAIRDERYEAHADALLDLYLPGGRPAPDAGFPIVLWIHGGAFVGGSKEEIAYYLKIIAEAGFAVAAIRYSLAPEARYPAPVEQATAALLYLQINAERLGVDAARIVLAGDSAGAQIAAQVAAIATDPVYARDMGITPAVGPEQLRGVVLCCGIYDLTALGRRSPAASLIKCAGWSYAGTRDFEHDESFISTMSVTRHVSPSFPPAFITAGDTDPLESQSRALAEALARFGVPVETAFFAPGQQPPLTHEYQFDLDLDRARATLGRIIAFAEHATCDEAPAREPALID